MSFIFYGIAIFLVLFTLWMFIATAAIGTKYLKTTQYYMSILEFNAEADEKIKLVLDKFENNLLTAILDTQLGVIRFHDTESGEFNSEIWIQGKYTVYGMLSSYGKERNKTWKNYKPSLSTFKRVIALENKLLSELPEKECVDDYISNTSTKSSKSKQTDTVVLK